MRPRNTLFLLVVLAALGAYIYWVELPQEARKAEEKRLVAADKANVAKIALDYPGRSIVVEKSGDRWRMVTPIEADADAAVIGNMLTAITTAQVERTLDDVGDKLASYGLDKPEATATLTLADGTTLPPLKVGKTTAVGFSAYVQKGDDPKVFVTGQAFQNGMKKEVKDLREKTVITFEDPEVRKIELARPDGTVTVEREGESDGWAITAPARHRADDAEMRSLLSNLRGIRATDFASDDPAADPSTYGLATPQVTVKVWLGKDLAQKTVALGETTDRDGKKAVYAKRGESPTVYTIPEYSLKNVDKSLTTLRDKTVLAFDKEKAAKVTVTRKDGAGFALVKREGKWHLEGPGEGAEREPTITRYIDDLAGLKGTDILAEGTIDLARFGLAPPDLTATVEDALGTPLGTLLGSIGTGGPKADADATSYVAAQGQNVVYGIKPFVYGRVDKKAEDFRERPAAAPDTAASPGAERRSLRLDAPVDDADDVEVDEDDLGVDEH